MTAIDTDTTIVSDITINAPAAKIFDAITDPKQVPAWWRASAERGVAKALALTAKHSPCSAPLAER